MGALASLFLAKDPRHPVSGFGPRIKNLIKMNFRGLIGFFIPLFILTSQGEKGRNDKTVQCVWMMMFWFFLWQPVNIPSTALIPIFIFPMTGVMSTVDTCQCYFNENMALFILGGMLLLLLNNSGVDRRAALWFLCSGDASRFSGKRLIFKASLAAFFLSMFSNRLIVSSTIIQYVTPAFTDLQAATSRSRGTEPNYDEMRYIVNNAIQTASAIGSTSIMHAAFATLAFRAIWCESAPPGKEYPDLFNYLQYSCFAFPVALVIFILNFCYHMLLINWIIKKPMSAGSMGEIRRALLKHKDALPKITFHEKLTVFFTIFALVMFVFRWCDWLSMGWGTFRKEEASPTIPGVKDASVAALFVIVLHILPKSSQFMKIFKAHKKSQLPPIKAESAILWWRFVDKNTNYGYIFLLGSGIALNKAVQVSGLATDVANGFGQQFSNKNFAIALLLVVLIGVILSNIMSGVAACVIFMPFILSLNQAPDWPAKAYLGALGVGMASSFGFMFPFLYTPAYFCHYTGKVPIKKMVKYGWFSVVIAFVILWIALVVWGPIIWDPSGVGITPVDSPYGGGNETATTEATTAGGDEGGGGGGGGDGAL